MIINGNLNLNDCEKLTSLYNLKEVNGNLDLRYTLSLNNLGSLNKINGNLYLSFSNILLLENINISGNIDFDNTKIEILSKSLNINGIILILEDSKIHKIEDNFTTTSCVVIRNKLIKEIPYGFKSNDLIIKDSEINKISPNVIINNNVYLYNLKNIEISNDFTINGNLFLFNCNIEINLINIKGKIYNDTQR